MELKNKEGELLDYDLRGEAHLAKKKLVIICHGLADDKDAHFLAELGCEIAARGLSCLNVSFSGNGKSEGSFEEATYHKEVADLQAVIDIFKEKKNIQNICLVGHSMGGGVIRVVAAQEPAVKALVVLAGVAHAESFKEKFPELVKTIEEGGKGFFNEKRFGQRYPITEKYIESALTINIMDSAQNIQCPVLCVIGAEDATIRREQEKEWLAALPREAKSWFVVLPGLDHGFNRFGGDVEAQKGADYLKTIVVPWLLEFFA